MHPVLSSDSCAGTMAEWALRALTEISRASKCLNWLSYFSCSRWWGWFLGASTLDRFCARRLALCFRVTRTVVHVKSYDSRLGSNQHIVRSNPLVRVYLKQLTSQHVCIHFWKGFLRKIKSFPKNYEYSQIKTCLDGVPGLWTLELTLLSSPETTKTVNWVIKRIMKDTPHFRRPCLPDASVCGCRIRWISQKLYRTFSGLTPAHVRVRYATWESI